jgi:hypothetical protein
MIEKAHLEIADDVSVGDWIRESLAPWIMFSEIPVTIGIVIPKGFENYVLIRHVGPGDNHGGLGNENLGRLLKILSKFTITPEECFHAVWDGQGWMHSGGIATYRAVRHPKLHGFFRNSKISRFFRTISFNIGARRFRKRIRTQDQSLDHLAWNTLPDGIMKSGRFRLPNRDYLLMRGPLSEATKIGWAFSESFQPEPPNLLWPRDRGWILANEIDFNVTLIGGSESLVTAILNSSSLTAERFNITDAIAQLPVADY